MRFLPLFTALSFTLTPATAQVEYSSKPLVLSDVTILDMKASRPLPGKTVVIRGKRIAEIRDAAGFKAEANAVVVDGRGKFLIPGLWDMHVHALSKALPERFLPLFIANGVTGIRDMGGDLPLREVQQIKQAITAGEVLGPRIKAAGPIVDGANPVWPFSIRVATLDDATSAVNTLVHQGADFIKVYAGLSPEHYFALTAAARREKIAVTGHIPRAVSSVEASRAGQKSIEHLIGVRFDTCSNGGLLRTQSIAANNEEDPAKARALFMQINEDLLTNYDEPRAQQTFREYVKNGTWHTPTLVVLRAYNMLHDPEFVKDARIRYIPEKIRASWKPRGKPDARNHEMQRRLFESALGLVKAMHSAGVGIVVGTDTPNPYVFPGFSVHDELAWLVRAGLSPLQALQAATLKPAELLELQNDLGTIEEGKLADLVLLNADPTADIENAKNIHSVVVNGRLLRRADLDRILFVDPTK